MSTKTAKKPKTAAMLDRDHVYMAEFKSGSALAVILIKSGEKPKFKHRWGKNKDPEWKERWDVADWIGQFAIEVRKRHQYDLDPVKFFEFVTPWNFRKKNGSYRIRKK